MELFQNERTYSLIGDFSLVEVSVRDIKFVFWQEMFLKTFAESDPEKLARLVPRVELAMFRRELELYDCSPPREELITMCVAYEALRALKRRITRRRVLEPSKGNPARFAKFVRRSGAA
jgi:hypothetical protein